jgi:hypothetical protein
MAPKQGWYRLVNIDKFVKPKDSYMKSFNESAQSVQYKSSLELRAFRYADMNPKIKHWSCEPFAIPYIKPTDGKVHRYYIDLYLEFKSGKKFLVEIKSKSETSKPKQPKKLTEKSKRSYDYKLATWFVNKAKWEAAEEFCKNNNMVFKILTEEQLN